MLGTRTRIMHVMDQKQVIKTLQELLPEFSRASAPDDVLLKLAHDRNLPEAIVEKLGQIYNSARTVHQMEKAGSEGRGSVSGLIDVPAMLARLSSERADAAKRAHDGVTLLAGLVHGFAKPASRRADAALREHFIFDLPGEREAIEKVAAAMRAADPVVVAEPAPSLLARSEVLRGEMEGISLEIGATRRVMEKLAGEIEDTLDRQHARRDLFPADMLALCRRADTEAILDKLASFGVRFTQKYDTVKAANTSRTWPQDRLGLLDTFEKFAEALDYLEAATTLLEEKRAGTFTGTNTNTKGKGSKRDPSRPSEYVEPSEESMVSAPVEPAAAEYPPSAIGEAVRGYDFGALRSRALATIPDVSTGDAAGSAAKAIMSVSSDPKVRRNRIVEAVSDARSTSNIQRLMLTDPVISEADPRMVEDVLSTVLAYDPTISQNYLALRSVVREALQYGAVPLQTTKGLAETRKAVAEARAKERSLVPTSAPVAAAPDRKPAR